MKILKAIGLTLAIALLALVGLYFAMAERVEVVVLHTHAADGERKTRIWVVDDADHAWLRTGGANATWLPRLRADSRVEVERGGETRGYDAIAIFDPATVARINELTLEKYGWSEQLLRAVFMDPAGQVAIRLDPLPGAAQP